MAGVSGNQASGFSFANCIAFQYIEQRYNNVYFRLRQHLFCFLTFFSRVRLTCAA